MLVHLLRWLGVAPRIAGKSGKREAAWLIIAIALILTGAAMWAGTEMVGAMTAVLMIVWPSALGLLGAAYKLEYDQTKKDHAASAPPDWPSGIVPPEGFAGDGTMEEA